ncbi:MAG TPA: hypothetical protein VHT52_04120 [Stellaceae bacterium]|jgi:hypothetical protein|nr:hypothetical protein [Stellaceae bacterium]
MTLTILGIDIGVKGALALINEAGALLEVWDMPCLNDGPKNRRTVNAPLLAEIIYKSHATIAVVERVGPRPGEGSVGAFAFGDAKGVVRGVLAAAAIPGDYLTPAQWKRAVGLPPGKEGAKDRSRSEAIRRWPLRAETFKRKLDDGRAESALIAIAGLRLGFLHGLREVSRDDDGAGLALPGVLGGPGELLRRRTVQ